MTSIVTELADLLSKAVRPGDFYTSGTTKLLPPSLVVEGVGQIALPLLPVQARELVATAERAPYGRGPDTIVDTSVRNSWQIGPDRVRIGGRHWPSTLARILELVAEGLGVGDPTEAEFYKMLIYEEGSFFVSHRDTEKSPGMFATLVIVLPSSCSGGDLVVKHKDRSVRLDLRGDDPSEVAFAAFYADCLHEVLPVTAGCRLTLVYNLIRRGKGRVPQPPNYTDEQNRVAVLLRRWRAELDAASAGADKDETEEDEDKADDDELEEDEDETETAGVPAKLVYPLEHAYTAPELGFSVLKGADAAAASVLAAAAKQADCALHLALVTLDESGSAEYSQTYDRRHRWSRDDDDDDEFEVGEVTDWHIGLSDWRALDGDPVSWGEIPVSDDELSPPHPFHDLEPDELHFEEASGNAGVSFERRYRRAALVVWPNDRSFAVLTQAGVGVTVPHLRDLAQRWVANGAEPGSPFWQQAHDLSGHMIGQWPTYGGLGLDGAESAITGMLTALTRLGDTERIALFIRQVVAAGNGYATPDNPAIISALRLLLPDEAAAVVRAVVTAKAATRFAACADLLVRISATPSLLQRKETRTAAATLLAAMPTGTTGAESYNWSMRSDAVDAGFVADLLVSLGAIDPALASQAVTRVLGDPGTFDMDAIVVPAARDRLRAPEVAAQPAVARLIAACLAHLRARIALPLSPPQDWRREAAVGCKCRHCGELSRFLADPKEKVWVFRAVEADRRHVEGTIRTARCDVDMRTEKRGRPYSLICTKNQASYERRVTQRKQDLANEASLDG